jgi:hypothetical protein
MMQLMIMDEHADDAYLLMTAYLRNNEKASARGFWVLHGREVDLVPCPLSPVLALSAITSHARMCVNSTRKFELPKKHCWRLDGRRPSRSFEPLIRAAHLQQARIAALIEEIDTHLEEVDSTSFTEYETKKSPDFALVGRALFRQLFNERLAIHGKAKTLRGNQGIKPKKVKKLRAPGAEQTTTTTSKSGQKKNSTRAERDTDYKGREGRALSQPSISSSSVVTRSRDQKTTESKTKTVVKKNVKPIWQLEGAYPSWWKRQKGLGGVLAPGPTRAGTSLTSPSHTEPGTPHTSTLPELSSVRSGSHTGRGSIASGKLPRLQGPVCNRRHTRRSRDSHSSTLP